ncbi:caspase family protein [Oceanococcus atlanticus]|uniref:caspase family protein n=1 Tax=Oceanococcus atlanticus TaxID=1317117 RepID=UPI0011BA67DF|nr:caspase family protein [Oceanococcus atlanticus]
MNKKILLISNPGEPGAENYCEGVNVDVREYKSYFTSPIGGAWTADEIRHLDRPRVDDVRQEISALANLDYSLVIFCGHGWYSATDSSTILELRAGQSMDEAELRYQGAKRTILLDCCRKVYRESLKEELLAKSLNFCEDHRLSGAECRKYYESAISNASAGLVILHACDVNETAGDDSKRGGYYSDGLRRSALDWDRATAIDLSQNYRICSVVESHGNASELVGRRSGGRQNPQIEKPRSKPYFPFAVLA